MRQQNHSAPRGAVRTHRLSGGSPPQHGRQAAEHLVQQRRRRAAPRPRSAPRGRRGMICTWKGTRDGERADRHRLVVDGHDPLAPAHLLLDQVLRAGCGPACARAYAVKRSRSRATARGHEGQRVELRVRVRQRRAGLAALVDDQVHVGRAGVRAHALAPHAHRGLDLLGPELGQRVHRPGALTITSWAPAAGREANRSGSPRPPRQRVRLRRPARPARARGRGSAPRAPASPAPSGAPPSARSA